MDYKKLGTSSLEVSEICYGTMMMGSQNDAKSSKPILSAAFDSGINFFDTAEMYSVPPDPKTQGNSENIVGDWIKENKNRDQIILATKVTGRSDMNWVRGKDNQDKVILDKKNITYAIENSLTRLKTDYIDLYQIHWPDRLLPMFGFDLEEAALDDPKYIPIQETLNCLAELVKEGKIRHVGVSNENINGVKEYHRLAKELNLPMISSIQNAYSLVNRSFEGELANYCLDNKIGLMPYSILAMGYLSGKYMNQQLPEGSRKQLFQNTTRYKNIDENDLILSKYKTIADKEGISMSELAHAFVYRQAFVDSTIIGGTNLDQLEENIAAYDIELSDDCISALDQVQSESPNPCP